MHAVHVASYIGMYIHVPAIGMLDNAIAIYIICTCMLGNAVAIGMYIHLS